MTAGFEKAAAEEWLFDTLTTDTALMAMLPGGATAGVNNRLATQGTPYPLVIYQFSSGIDYAAVGAERIWTNMIWIVKAVAELDHVDGLAAIVARLDTLLHRKSGTPTHGTVWSSVRESVIDYPDEVAGKQFVHSGAMYRLYAS